MTIAIALLLTDRRIASAGMRWDANFIPAAYDIATLRKTPQDAEDALARLWLRTIRGRLSPDQASEVVEALLPAAPRVHDLDGGSALLGVAGLRASRIADPDRYVDACMWHHPVRTPTLIGPIAPGGRFPCPLLEAAVEPIGWAHAYLIRSIRLNGRELELEGGRRLMKGRLVWQSDRCVALVPESMPEGDHAISILFENVLVPRTAGNLLLSAPEEASIDDLGLKMIRRERSRLGMLSVRADGEVMGPRPGTGTAPRSGERWFFPPPGSVPFAADLTPLRMTVIASLAGVLLPLGLLCFLGLRKLARGSTLLIVPCCAACRSTLHAGATRCSECGRDAALPRALTFRTSPLRIASVCLLTPIIFCGSALAAMAVFPGLERRFSGELPSSAYPIDRLAVEISRAAKRGLDAAAVKRIFSLLHFSPDLRQLAPEDPRRERLRNMLRELLTLLDQRPNDDIAIDSLHFTLDVLFDTDFAGDTDLLNAWHRVLMRRLSLTPLRHRAGTWSRAEAEDLNASSALESWATPEYRLRSIEGVPARTRNIDFHPSVEHQILVPETPGPFEVTMVGRWSDDLPPSRKVIRLESVAPGEPLAQYTTEPRRNPFRNTPALILHQVDDRPPRGRWRAYLDFEQPPECAAALGSWSIESAHGTFAVEPGAEGEIDVDPDLLGPPGTPVLLRFEPHPPEAIDPDRALLLWAAPERRYVTPVWQPLGWWLDEWWWW